MNLETHLDERLWRSIESHWTAGTYTSAVLDALHFLSDLIREKSGLDTDGVQLVGKAFGGKSPLVKVNRLNTESELNEQAGVEAMLRGLYQGVRNPRSHGPWSDSAADATALILFVNYLVGVIDRSRSIFTLSTFVERVLDPDFVDRKRYAELLVQEIPKKSKFDVIVEVYQRRQEGQWRKLESFFQLLLADLKRDERRAFFQLVSETLLDAVDDADIYSTVALVSGDLWPEVSELARMRVESRLYESLKGGRHDVARDRNVSGGFGTWIGRILKQAHNRKSVEWTLLSKLESDSRPERHYAAKFLPYLSQVPGMPSDRLKKALVRCLEEGDEYVKSHVENATMFEEEKWGEEVVQALREFTPPTPEFDFNDDLPF